MCVAAGDDRNKASPAISEGAPKRPVGWPAVKASSPADLSPNAVIFEGKRLGERGKVGGGLVVVLIFFFWRGSW